MTKKEASVLVIFNSALEKICKSHHGNGIGKGTYELDAKFAEDYCQDCEHLKCINILGTEGKMYYCKWNNYLKKRNKT